MRLVVPLLLLLDLQLYQRLLEGTTPGNIVFNTAVTNIDGVSGVSLVSGSRILIKDISSATNGNDIYNGIYLYSTDVTMDRADDFENGSDITGTFTFVEAGTDNRGKGFVTMNTGSVGTNAMEFTTFLEIDLQAGDGIVITGGAPSTISVSGQLNNVYELGQLNSQALLIGNSNENTTIQGQTITLNGDTILSGLTAGTTTLANTNCYRNAWRFQEPPH